MSDFLIDRLNTYRASILIVDDEPINAEILANALQQDYWVHIAASGPQALDILRKQTVDLILLDIRMPEMDGFEVLRRLKSEDKTAQIPVVFVTGEDSADDELKGLQMGAVDYVRKPFQVPLAKARIAVQIELKVKSDLLEELASADGLTGIANRRKFDEMLDTLYADCHRHNRTLALLLIDIDYFKQFNDTYGHAVGDMALKRVASVLHDNAQRGADVVARVGGEEFAVLLPDVSQQQLTTVCERIHASVAGLGIEHSQSRVSDHLTVSIGAASILPNTQHDKRYLYQKADELLYKAKHLGRAQTVMKRA